MTYCRIIVILAYHTRQYQVVTGTMIHMQVRMYVHMQVRICCHFFLTSQLSCLIQNHCRQRNTNHHTEYHITAPHDVKLSKDYNSTYCAAQQAARTGQTDRHTTGIIPSCSQSSASKSHCVSTFKKSPHNAGILEWNITE